MAPHPLERARWGVKLWTYGVQDPPSTCVTLPIKEKGGRGVCNFEAILIQTPLRLAQAIYIAYNLDCQRSNLDEQTQPPNHVQHHGRGGKYSNMKMRKMVENIQI